MEVDKAKRAFDGEWKRTSETGFSKFLRFNGIPYLLSFPLAAKGSNMRIRVSEDLQTITAESTGLPSSPPFDFKIGDKVSFDVNGRICLDTFLWDIIEGKVQLNTIREDYNRNHKMDVVITRFIRNDDPNILVCRLVATKTIDGSIEECEFLYTRHTGSSLF